MENESSKKCNQDIYQPTVTSRQTFQTFQIIGEYSWPQTIFTFATQLTSPIQSSTHETVELCNIFGKLYINLLYMSLVVVEGATSNNCQLYFILQAIKYWRWERPGNKASIAIHNTG